MKYLIANDQTVLTDMGGADETIMFPQNAVLSIEGGITTMISQVQIQSSKDTDDADIVAFRHANTNWGGTHKVGRTIIDEIVSVINSDSRLGYTVLLDRLNLVCPVPSADWDNMAGIGYVTED